MAIDNLWHQVLYRQYVELLPEYRPSNPQQSWVRSSGEALEIVVERLYEPILLDHGVRIDALISPSKKRDVLRQIHLLDKVGGSKLDIALYVRKDDSWTVFGGVHVKASLAERVSDDVPTSKEMMNEGYFSPLWTLDVKSFPPPQGDLVNRGELGTPGRPSDKREYVERNGDFDNCYSANARTVPSAARTFSGKRVYRLNLSEQPDAFATDVVERALDVAR